jgi:lactate dehydrogenase-like 2-hydroxyacid dehydrogenase
MRNKFLVKVTRLIPEEGIIMLKEKGCEVEISPFDRVLTKAELKSFVVGADAILSLLTDKIDGEVLDAAGPQLKIVANYAVGFDNIDLAAAKTRKIFVTNVAAPEVSEAVAEHTFGLMLDIARRISEGDRFLRAGKYLGWEPMLLLGDGLDGKTLGIVGLGRIGTSVARRATRGFRMKVLYNDVKQNPDFEAEFGGRFVAKLDDLLPQCDVITLHVPLLPSTFHLIDSKKLSLMKRTAILINTSRGPVVDEKALVEILKKRKIAGAGLDVYEAEPALSPGLLELENIVITPHTASATMGARQAMSRAAAENIIAVVEGAEPGNVVR